MIAVYSIKSWWPTTSGITQYPVMSYNNNALNHMSKDYDKSSLVLVAGSLYPVPSVIKLVRYWWGNLCPWAAWETADGLAALSFPTMLQTKCGVGGGECIVTWLCLPKVAVRKVGYSSLRTSSALTTCEKLADSREKGSRPSMYSTGYIRALHCPYR